MSAPPPPGQYVIYSNTGGEKMALTFQGSFKPVTVETLVPNSAQIWKVENGLSTVQQAIIPLNAVVLQASWGTDQHVNVSDTPDSFWLVREADNGYTITDGGGDAEWRTTGLAGEKVTIEAINGAPAQRWVFEEAPEQ